MSAFDFRYFTFVLTLLSFRAFGATPPLRSSGNPKDINAQTNNTAAPPPKPGQSFGEWIDSLFAPTAIVSAQDQLDARDTISTPLTSKRKSVKRSYTNNHGVGITSWANETANEAYEIRVDFSGCKTGLKFSTDIGVYTHTDGRTTNSTTLQDLTNDIYTLHTSTVDYRTRRHIVNTRYANHTEVLAQLAMQEAYNALLGLLCQSETTAIASDPGYDISESPLLSAVGHVKDPNQNVSWLTVIGSSAETPGGITLAGAATGFSEAYGVNVTETSVQPTGRDWANIKMNLLQTGVVVGLSGLVGGILHRMQAVGRLANNPAPVPPAAAAAAVGVAGAAAAAAAPYRIPPGRLRARQSVSGDSDNTALLQSLAPSGREALEQNVFIAWFRGNVQQIVGGAVQGVQTSATGDVASCVTIEKALQVAADLQQVASQALELEPFDQLEKSLQNAHPAGGGCGA